MLRARHRQPACKPSMVGSKYQEGPRSKLTVAACPQGALFGRRVWSMGRAAGGAPALGPLKSGPDVERPPPGWARPWERARVGGAPTRDSHARRGLEDGPHGRVLQRRRSRAGVRRKVLTDRGRGRESDSRWHPAPASSRPPSSNCRRAWSAQALSHRHQGAPNYRPGGRRAPYRPPHRDACGGIPHKANRQFHPHRRSLALPFVPTSRYSIGQSEVTTHLWMLIRQKAHRSRVHIARTAASFGDSDCCCHHEHASLCRPPRST